MGWADVKAPQKPCDGKECRWEEFQKRISDMLDDPDYSYAWDFLERLDYWITQRKHITGKQRRAVHNIEQKPGRTGRWDEDDFGSMSDFLGD